MERMQIPFSFHRIPTRWSITTESVTMATLELSIRRLAQCPSGEEEDLFTGACVPHTVPNSGASFSGIPGNPDLPSIDGVPCTGHNSGQCIGLAEESEDMGPQPVPRSTVSSSP
jgi:hypothetical protein